MRTLLFVYNADAGLWNAVMDSLHKLFAPKTYPCSLCAITYGLTQMKGSWKTFIEEELQDFQPTFLHKDEFTLAFGETILEQYDLPAVFWVEQDQQVLELLIPKETMDQLSLEALQDHLRKEIAKYRPKNL